MRPKLMVLGFDGMDFETVQEIKYGMIPKLKKRAEWGVLKSISSTVAPTVPHTGPCWSSIYSGLTPDEHGITSGGWLLKHKTWQDLDKKRISLIFDEIGRHYSIGMMTMPVTFPARPVQGWMVSGFPAPLSLDKRFYFNAKLPKNFIVEYVQTKNKGFDLKKAKSIAWNKIKDRKGKMVEGGVFIKEEDLK